MTAPLDQPPAARVLVNVRAVEHVAHNLTDVALRLEQRKQIEMALLVQQEARTVRALLAPLDTEDHVAAVRERAADLKELLAHLHREMPGSAGVAALGFAVGLVIGAASNLEEERKAAAGAVQEPTGVMADG